MACSLTAKEDGDPGSVPERARKEDWSTLTLWPYELGQGAVDYATRGGVVTYGRGQLHRIAQLRS